MKVTLSKQGAGKFLDFLNAEYFKRAKLFEELYWISYMGDHSIDKKFAKAQDDLTKFQSDKNLAKMVDEAIAVSGSKLKERLLLWQKLFRVYQIPKELLPLRDKIAKKESYVQEKRLSLKWGYTDPKTKKFVEASHLKMWNLLTDSPDEKVRKACYEALEKFAVSAIGDYLEYVALLNQFARGAGFSDFYAYKVFIEEGMTKKELFEIFDKIFDKTKGAFKNIQSFIKKNPGMEKPWNFSYMISADFSKEEDPYFQFSEALPLWTKTFSNLGIDFRGSHIVLDLLDRKGKSSNGFCRWPVVIHYKNGKRQTGKSNFTCNVVPGAIGSGQEGIHTLFHEGGHSAHLLNSDQIDVCTNAEYPPSSTAWAETQSMFLDTISGSIEWRTRYAKNAKGEFYPFDLFKRKLDKLHIFSPLRMMSIMKIMYFEKEVFETKNLNKKKLLEIAQKTRAEFSALKHNSFNLLDTHHLYHWDSACSYHGYGLAELALSQWREYFFKKYGFIVDNKMVGREMTKVWKLGFSKTFPELVKIATGKPLSPNAFIKSTMRSKSGVLKIAKERIERLAKVKTKPGDLNLGAKIEIFHGKQKITDNSKSFESMVSKYQNWLRKQK